MNCFFARGARFGASRPEKLKGWTAPIKWKSTRCMPAMRRQR